MAANVETMVYSNTDGRGTPWHGQGVSIDHFMTSIEALDHSGLNWDVISKPIQVCGGNKIEGYTANVRSSDGAVLGVVGKRYKIVQNRDAFGFVDGIIGEGCAAYDTAGSLNGGKTVWMLVKLDQTNLVGDATDNYLCFANTHDGSGSVKVCITPVRVVCNNTLNAALSGAQRILRMRHTTNVDKRIDEAREVLGLTARYQVELAEFAEAMAKKKVDDLQLKAILNSIFDPKGEKPSDLQKRNAEESKQAFYVCYAAPDIAKFQGTAWGAINAMSDLVGHSLPHRQTKTYDEMNWGRIMDGHTLFDQMVEAVK